MTKPVSPSGAILRVEQCQAIDAIEASYSKIQMHPGTLDISIPTTTRDAQCGAIGSLIQLLITWAKQNPSRHLLMHDTKEEALLTQIHNLSQTPHGLVALLVSPQVSSATKHISMGVAAEKATLDILAQMCGDPLGYSSGPEVTLLSADDTTLRYIPQLYLSTSRVYGQMRSHEEFVNLSGSIIDHLTSIYRRNAPIAEDVKETLGTILHELFKNTDLWARHEVDNRPIRRSVRGLRLELTSRRLLRLDALAANHVQYVKQLDARQEMSDLLEVAVFDSGPGLAARALGRDPDQDTTLADEYLGVLNCLRLHATSSSKSHHGVGLLEVMRALSHANAFLRVRTGRLALYRDFIASPLLSDDDLILADWFSRSPVLTDCGRAEGLLLSIIVPVPIEKQLS